MKAKETNTTRICITITESQHKSLKRLAFDKDMKQSALIRKAIKEYYGI